MPRQLNKLTAKAAQAAIKQPGRHGDGGGLSLVVTDDGRARWVLRYALGGKVRDMGLGSGAQISLADARKAAAEARALVASGKDPLTEREREVPKAETFGECADALIASMQPGWRNAKHVWQWRQTLGDDYCTTIRKKDVAAIETADVLEVLKKIWIKKAETASRLRGRIERVLDSAKARGLRSGENPARWRGHLDHLLPKRKKLTRGHHPSMPAGDIPAFMKKLAEMPDVSAAALRFTILTAARTGETIGATWSEIDLSAKVWTVPAARMKAGKEHRVPLSDEVISILDEVARLGSSNNPRDGFIFSGRKRESKLSNMAMSMMMRRQELPFAVHGFRSSFRDWCGDQTNFPRDIVEAALAHQVGNETERAYRRLDALEKRRKLMDAWARFCTTSPTENVVPLRAAKK